MLQRVRDREREREICALQADGGPDAASREWPGRFWQKEYKTLHAEACSDSAGKGGPVDASRGDG